jgi:hypothetical protein
MPAGEYIFDWQLPIEFLLFVGIFLYLSVVRR